MKAKLSELKLNKVRKILEYEIDGVKKEIVIYNAIGKKRENILSLLKVGNQIEDKDKAADMLYKSILKELVEIDIDVKKTNSLMKTPSLTLLKLNHEIDEIMCEIQCEFIYDQMRMLNQSKISALTALSLNKVEEIKEEVEKIKDGNI